MKKIFLLITMLALMPFAAINAQDARQRTTETIVADALVQLPAQTPEVYNEVIAELAATGSQGVEMIADMLQVPAEGVNNSPMEYALQGIAAYVSKDNEALRGEVRKGFKAAFANEEAPVLKAYLMNMLEICATADDADFYVAQLKDDYLDEHAVHALAAIKGTEGTILSLIENQAENGICKYALAEMASYKHIPAAEDILIGWVVGAKERELALVYNALASCGGAKAEKVLAIAAKSAGYAFEATDSYGAYRLLLNRLVEENAAVAAKGAKKLMKVEKNNVRLQGLDILARVQGKQTLPLIIKAQKDESRDYRYGALLTADNFADDDTYAAIAAALPKAANEAKVDILNYLGASHAEGEIDAIAAHISSECDCVATAAIKAAGRIGGDKALEAIMAEIATLKPEGKVYNTAIATLLAFNGEIDEAVVEALEGNDTSKAAALQILQKRRITEAADKVLAMAEAGCPAAEKALPMVAAEKNFDALCAMLIAGKGDKAAVSKAITMSLKELEASEQVKRIESKMTGAEGKAHLFYPILAATGAKEAIAPIIEGYNNGNVENSAFASLCIINDDSLIDQMYEIATENEQLKEQAVARYIDLVKGSKLNGEQKFARYRAALELNPSTANKNKALRALSPTQTYQGMMLAASYMDDEATAQAAANTVLEIATKHPEFYSAELKALLEKVGSTLNDSDAVYKRKDIEKFISENKASENRSVVTVLSAEEQAEGFEMLFDGVNMDKWQGNTAAYQPINGHMYVTASYGSTGNLYTKKEYADFVLRFEFCFDRIGVNNGVGIRTEMGKDAAYYGMEIQLLHHDAPIYKNLKAHQVHGSVYGIIPAKRIKWDGIGEWHSEEIRVKGDHITVTVDGEVIVDGNIRKACKGHNVAPDGGKKNPYTVDGYNHPGLFNKKGYICFCGHGEGIMLRNVRVKEL